MRFCVTLIALILMSFVVVDAKDVGLEDCKELRTKVQKYECLVDVIRSSGYVYDFGELSDDGPFYWGVWTLDDWYIIGKSLGGKVPAPISASNGHLKSINSGNPFIRFLCAPPQIEFGIGSGGSILHEQNGKAKFLTWFDGSGPVEQEWKLEPGKKGVVILVKDIKVIAGYLESLIAADEVVFKFDTVEHGEVTLKYKTGSLPLAFYPVLIECPI